MRSFLPCRVRCAVCCGRGVRAIKPLHPYPRAVATRGGTPPSFLLDDALKTASSAAFLALEKTKGHIVAISIGGQLRVPDGSDGRLSRHTANRLVEFVTLEQPSICKSALAPGHIPMSLAAEITGILKQRGLTSSSVHVIYQWHFFEAGASHIVRGADGDVTADAADMHSMPSPCIALLGHGS
ncbi:hypothetical protein BJV77DRAFT_160272 [Russula vinacea]|nr:hypothetical protein BJV77DRAFT_160272 [Russula vinacea]